MKQQEELMDLVAQESDQFGQWISVKQPPEMTENLYGWPSSPHVLTWDGRRMRIAYIEQIDEDAIPEWRSACSEGWILKQLISWMPLPQEPES